MITPSEPTIVLAQKTQQTVQEETSVTLNLAEMDLPAVTKQADCRTWFDNSVIASIKSGWTQITFVGRREKRFDAITRVWQKVSERFPENNPFDTMPTVTFFAPSLNIYGEVMQAQPDGVFVYLSPILECESQRDVDFTVAHELAHVALGHYDEKNIHDASHLPHEEQPHEIAADATAEEWGFPRRKQGKKVFVKMMESYYKPPHQSRPLTEAQRPRIRGRATFRSRSR